MKHTSLIILSGGVVTLAVATAALSLRHAGHFGEWASVSPPTPDVVGDLGNFAETLVARGNFVGAERLLRRLNGLEPENIRRRRLFVRVLYEEGGYSEGIECCRDLLAAHPRDIVLLNSLGMLLAAGGDRSGGIGVLAVALKYAPNQVYVLENLAYVCKLDCNERLRRYYSDLAASARREAAAAGEPTEIPPLDVIVAPDGGLSKEAAI